METAQQYFASSVCYFLAFASLIHLAQPRDECSITDRHSIGFQIMGRCFEYVYGDRKTWASCADYCVSYGGFLAKVDEHTLTDDTANKFAMHIGIKPGDGNNIHVGFRKAGGVAKWIDGTPVTVPYVDLMTPGTGTLILNNQDGDTTYYWESYMGFTGRCLCEYATTGAPKETTTTDVPKETTTTGVPEEPTTTGVPEETTTTGVPEEPTTTGVPEEPTTTGVPEEPTTTGVPEGTTTTGVHVDPTTPVDQTTTGVLGDPTTTEATVDHTTTGVHVPIDPTTLADPVDTTTTEVEQTTTRAPVEATTRSVAVDATTDVQVDATTEYIRPPPKADTRRNSPSRRRANDTRRKSPPRKRAIVFVERSNGYILGQPMSQGRYAMVTMCCRACQARKDCDIFNYNSVTKQCRLFSSFDDCLVELDEQWAIWAPKVLK